MEKKSKIQLATFFGLGFWTVGFKTQTQTFNGSEGLASMISSFIVILLPFVGTLLLCWVAGEIYSSKNK